MQATMNHDDDARWNAVVRRDATADGTFVFSVRSTGVYCRPSCAARRARRENVRFHATSAAAERAGFRACKRCMPGGRSRSETHALLVADACRTIERAEVPPHLDELAAAARLSPFHFHRIFRSITGVTPKAYAAAHRAQRVREGLSRGAAVTAALYDAGFNSSGRFYAAAQRELGMTPVTFKRGGRGETIRFAAGTCSLGAIVVAATGAGVCAILLGDDPAMLVRDLQDRFPRAEFVGGDGAFERLVATVVAFVEAPGIGLDLPLDVRGTAFQRRVWDALRAIPAGTTASYAEIARRIGTPGGARAVARACAANPLAVAIPCHRVIRVDGAASGYRWGIARKRALLDAEGAA